MPRSVMMALTSSAGVTSKAGLKIFTPVGAVCLPKPRETSPASRCSMGIFSTGQGEVDAAGRGGHVKRQAIVPRENGDTQRADFIGDIAIGGDAVGADDHGGDF